MMAGRALLAAHICICASRAATTRHSPAHREKDRIDATFLAPSCPAAPEPYNITR